MRLRGEWFKWTGTNKWGHDNPNDSFAMTVTQTGKNAYMYEVKQKAVQYSRIASGTVSTLKDAQAYAEKALLKFIKDCVIEV